jgi:hypothetical protein
MIDAEHSSARKVLGCRCQRDSDGLCSGAEVRVEAAGFGKLKYANGRSITSKEPEPTLESLPERAPPLPRMGDHPSTRIDQFNPQRPITLLEIGDWR